MPEFVFFLGSHPTLSELEIESVLGRSCALETLFSSLPLCVAKCKDEVPDTTFDRLGGTERVGVVIGKQLELWDAAGLLSLLTPLPKKWMLGISTAEKNFDFPSFAHAIKVLAQESGSKLKFVLPKGNSQTLNAAQVIFNRLDRSPNAEVILLSAASGWQAVKTVWIQDIRAYEIRDTSRPARSPQVGMLPPKLAQMMINLAVGDAPPATILDPFCGMGTIIQEGRLMGYQMIGSDSALEMVEASKQNLQWLSKHFDVSGDPEPNIFLHDARKPFSKELTHTIDAVVTEPYLGPPARSPAFAKASAGRPLLQDLSKLYIQAFRNFLPVLKDGGKVLFVFPAFAQRRGKDFLFSSDAMLDAIAKLGYRRVHPQGVGQRLLYARPDAWVGRELTLWERL